MIDSCKRKTQKIEFVNLFTNFFTARLIINYQIRPWVVKTRH
jgi:hypothetical protein